MSSDAAPVKRTADFTETTVFITDFIVIERKSLHFCSNIGNCYEFPIILKDFSVKLTSWNLHAKRCKRGVFVRQQSFIYLFLIYYLHRFVVKKLK